MNREIQNIPASIQARLQNKVGEIGQSFNDVLQYYGMERFLYRLSKTRHVNDFILKGGLMFYGLGIPTRRVTRDIDFLGIAENARRDILSVFRDAISVSFPEDGILFDEKTLRVSETQAEADQGGIRVSFVGHLGKMKVPIQVDVGFSDELASETLRVDYPAILADMETPRLRGYPPEAIISEKFHAMIRFADANSRWKDYYDIYLLSETFEFESRTVANAIRATFENRPTELDDQIPPGLRESFGASKQGEWDLFLEKGKLTNDSINDLKSVVKRIWQFLEYPLREILEGKELPSKRWTRGNGWK
ncbi:MAG: nucleotidyl transferase AbiEii/AbiGii toxin family protein [Chloroflexi bacterium]|nr:nucleotidyl transferase AbiEii/AbiGii toxin family protein [Chloroflexota bacterium]